MGSSMQVALLLAPIMVLASNLGSKTMTLVFTPLEVAAVGISTAITTIVNLDGESNWLEGAQLLSVYVILALAFYHAF
jgi:Ca2+:H+ antiporter